VYVGFFFQAEDGIRDLIVTGVQTCALPILEIDRQQLGGEHTEGRTVGGHGGEQASSGDPRGDAGRDRRPTRGEVDHGVRDRGDRSEERRVGKEGRERRWPSW